VNKLALFLFGFAFLFGNSAFSENEAACGVNLKTSQNGLGVYRLCISNDWTTLTTYDGILKSDWKLVSAPNVPTDPHDAFGGQALEKIYQGFDLTYQSADKNPVQTLQVKVKLASLTRSYEVAGRQLRKDGINAFHLEGKDGLGLPLDLYLGVDDPHFVNFGGN